MKADAGMSLHKEVALESEIREHLAGKLLESQALRVQARNNTMAQFANSPTLTTEIMNAVMDALPAHETMSKQAFGSSSVREGQKDVLPRPAPLYEVLRARGITELAGPPSTACLPGGLAPGRGVGGDASGDDGRVENI